MATTQLHPGGFPAAGLWSFSPKPPSGVVSPHHPVGLLTYLHPGGFPMARMWNFTAKPPSDGGGGAGAEDRFVGFIANVGRLMRR